jgi:WD40 repeat protein
LLVVGERGTTLGFGTCVSAWDVATQARVLPKGDGHAGAVTGLAAPPAGRLIVSAGVDRVVKLWDAATGRHLVAPAAGGLCL